MRQMQTSLMMLFAATMVLSGCGSTGETKPDDGNAANAANAAYGAGSPRNGGGAEISKYGAGGAGGAYGGAGGGAYVGDGSGGGAAGSRVGAGGGRYNGASPDDASGPLSKRVIYFQYDSSEVLPEYVQVINSHANYLAANPRNGVVLEGHADERGSPEYNIALGEQRAKSVAKLMKLQGVTDGQIQIVSFGEEKPQVSGHDDTAWQRNRRVEISYPRNR